MLKIDQRECCLGTVTVNMFSANQTVFQEKNLIPSVKYYGGNVMVLDCFAASGPQRLVVIQSTIHSAS